MPATLVGVPVALAALFGFAGAAWWGFDLLSSFRWQYLVLLTPALLVLAAARRWWSTTLVALALLADVAVVAPLYLGGAPPDLVPALRILSFNVQGAFADRGAVVEFIRESEADVVFLHEASIDWERDLLDADLEYVLTFSRPPEHVFGTAVLTLRPARVRPLRLGEGGLRSIQVDLPADANPIALLGIHAPSPVSAERAAARDRQLAAAGDWAAEQTTPHVVVGDFNATNWSHAFADLQRRGRLRNSQVGFGVQASWPVERVPLGDWLAIPIDHLLHSQSLVTVSRRLLPNFDSDHLALLVDLAHAS